MRLVESDLARLEDSLRSAIDRVVTPLMEVLTEPQVDLAREILELRECKLSLARDLEVVGKNNQRLERELASAHRHNRQLKEIVTQLRQRRAYGRLASR